MGSSYYLYKIKKDDNTRFERFAEENNMSIHDAYGNYFYAELTELHYWSKSNYLTKIFRDLGVKIEDSEYIQLTEDILKQGKQELIHILEYTYKKIINNANGLYHVELKDNNEAEKILQCINGINECLLMTNFNTELVLYMMSC